MTSSEPLWHPHEDALTNTHLRAFECFVERHHGQVLDTYADLHRWSIEQAGDFWQALWDYAGVIGDQSGPALEPGPSMAEARFFPGCSLNFAENLLRQTGPQDALVFRGEDQVRLRYSHDQLHQAVSSLQQALRAAGIKPGDRVAAMLPNMPQAIIGMLATSSLGAVWASCSPDFGESAVLDRFGQIEPKVLIACDGYWYAGKRIELARRLHGIVEHLQPARLLVVDYLGTAAEVAASLPAASDWDTCLAEHEPRPIEFKRLPAQHPLYILFSSGTTGVPKCIVHSQGGTLLQHMKEHQLQCDIQPGDRMFYFTTCGWMMWNWLATALASRATVMLYDGSPFHPDGNTLFDYAAEERFTFFGTSAKYIDSVRNAGLNPMKSHDLSALRAVASTGSPLAPENFRFVYSHIKADLHLASVSGGTDIVSCFVLGVPSLPVYAGEIQGPGLGMAVDVWNEQGQPVRQEKGELVCTRPFPSMPTGFWNDDDGSRYHKAYFARFDDVWCHGDFAEWTEHGGMIIHGRSDTTLNPGGVRIGTAEIYNQVEKLPEIAEAVCIGQQWPPDGNDVRVVLFVVPAAGITLDGALVKRIRQQIREGASPRHVPAVVVAVADIPRTRSGKITEIAVRDVVHDRPVANTDALANPEALELYRDLPQLRG